MSNDINHSFLYRLMLPNGRETPADVARHIGELVAVLALPFEGRERPALEGEELRGVTSRCVRSVAASATWNGRSGT